MKAELLDGGLASEMLDLDEMHAELLIDIGNNTYHYYLKGINPSLTLEYTCNLQSIVHNLLVINGQIKSGLDMLQISPRELELTLSRTLLLLGRVVKIISGRACGRTTHSQFTKDKIFAQEINMVPCYGLIRGWFLPGSLDHVETHNLSLLIQLENDSTLLLEITQFKYLVGEILEGKFSNIKQLEKVEL